MRTGRTGSCGEALDDHRAPTARAARITLAIDRAVGRRVTDSLVRPVAGVGDVRAGGRRPGGPEEERRQQPQPLRRGSRPRRSHTCSRVGAAPGRCRTATGSAAPHLRSRWRDRAGNGDRAAGSVIAVVAQLGAQRACRRPGARRRARVRNSAAGSYRPAVQPVGRPVRRHVTAMAPDRPSCWPPVVPDLATVSGCRRGCERRRRPSATTRSGIGGACR